MIGIDYSISSPAVYIGGGDFNSGKVLCFRPNRKVDSISDRVIMNEYPEWNCKEERYFKLANTCLQFILENTDEKHVKLEGYAYGAVGNVFDIAEATSVLKQMLYHNGFTVEILEPKVVKKHATGKGTANKVAMYEKFVELGYRIEDSITGLDLRYMMKKLPSPVTDIIDSYFIANAERVSNS